MWIHVAQEGLACSLDTIMLFLLIIAHAQLFGL